jgi:hypothetical protein
MSKLSQTKKIVKLLEENPLKRYTARELVSGYYLTGRIRDGDWNK